MAEYTSLLVLGVYVLLGAWLRSWRGLGHDILMACLNITVAYGVFFAGGDPRFALVYLMMVIGQYLAMRWWSEREGAIPWVAFLLPIFLLVAVRYVPPHALAGLSAGLRTKLEADPRYGWGAHFVGISYLAFRSSHLVLEVRNRIVPKPGFWTYLTFVFFVPTFSVGPITPYSVYRRGLTDDLRSELPVGRSLLRVLVGAVKCQFLAPLLNQFTYGELLLDGRGHSWVELPIAIVAYYLFLYANFSGFCDIAVGAGGLMGVPVAENFDNPFAARNVKAFWNRWHITLSLWMRDVVFSPISKVLVRVLGPARAHHAIALTILLVFLLVGIWHGAGWNYAAFGLMHALGVIANHYYTLGLKRWLGKDRFAAYNRSRWIQAAAVVSTFLYVAASLCLFANNGKAMQELLATLR